MVDERLEACVGRALRARGWTICAAESCTGGLLLHRLTNIPGSSDYVLGGLVAYANAVKENMLNVAVETMLTQGAVSAEVAREMALGARKLFAADVAVSITGIAGPGGGTAEKPVGLTFIGLAARGDVVSVQRHVWDGGRAAVKEASANAALQLVLDTLPPM